MNPEETYDVIIAGAGAAGLLLLQALLKHTPSIQKILLVDRTFEIQNDKTWSFWSRHDESLEQMAHRWDRVQVECDGICYSDRPEPYHYYSIHSGRFRKELLKQARESGRVTLLESDVTGFSESLTSAGGIVHTPSNCYSAAWVFQSIKKPLNWHSTRVDNALLQHFVGWEIRTTRNCFDPTSVILMDFDTEQLDGLTFFYLLPFDNRRALVEHTLFSDTLLTRESYEKAIETYLFEKFSLQRGDYTVLRTESGAIPMEDRKWRGDGQVHVRSIGLVAGLSKPSTGYTFSRMSRHAEQIAAALEKNDRPPSWSGSPFRFRVYDMMLLYLLAREQEYAVPIFQRLFDRNSISTIFRFLDEETHVSDELKIFFQMPWRPFLRSIRKMSHRILTGA